MINMVTVPEGERSLPAGFEELEEFVPHWAVAGQNARRIQRCSLTMDEIQRFYDKVYPRADEAMEHLDAFPLRDMPGPETRLKRLVLALAQASMSIEIHGEARVANSPWPNAMTIIAPEEL